MKTFKEYQPQQMTLIPAHLSEWLPDDHPIHFINEVVELLDLSNIYQDYRELSGQPPYHPKMMVKILIYAIAKRIPSSRKIEQALYDDIGFRYISGNQQPDHWTISDFRRRHHKALGELFVQTVKLAQKAGMVKLVHLAVDGTKIKANASIHGAMSYERMKKEEERLKQEIAELFKQMETNDTNEDRQYGNRRGDELPSELAIREKRLEAIEKAKKDLETEAQEKLKQEQAKRQQEATDKGKKFKPHKNKKEPKAKAQRNFTDSESRIMRSPHKHFIQGYNAQATVDGETRIIVAADITNQENDKEQLKPQIQQAIENTGKSPKEVSADAGYYSDKNCEYLSANHIEALIPPGRIKHNQWRETAIQGRIPKNATPEERMWRKLRTKRWKARYKLRQTSIEPTFGYIKEELGLRQFLHRGLDKTCSIWRFTCGVHNIMKLFRAKVDLRALIME
jgi:transposase